MNILEAMQEINTLVFDVDGVMTDGSLQILPNGEFIRTMNIKDGYALQLAVKQGYNVWVITGSSSDPVATRLSYLGIIHFYQKVSNKLELLQKLMQENNVKVNQVLFMGDDVPDLTAMKYAAIAACPADAAMDIIDIANYISPHKGGKGCVRDVIEKIMKLQNKWVVGNTASI